MASLSSPAVSMAATACLMDGFLEGFLVNFVAYLLACWSVILATRSCFREAAKAYVAKAAGAEFLKAAAAEAGAVQTASGLVIKMLEEGSGASPTARDTVEVNYEGKLIDGTVFDSSYQRGESISFPLSDVIKGWTEGLQLMKPGGKATLTIPPEIAYGPRGSPPVIPPEATLVFTIELIAVK